MLTLSWSVLLQTALLINHSRVLTFPDINNTAAPWPEWKRGNGQGFTLFFSLGYLQNSFSSWVWQNVKTVFLFICAEKFFTLPWTHARCHSTLPHGWGDLTLGSDTGHALARGILAGLTDRGCKGVWASELAPLHLCFHREKERQAEASPQVPGGGQGSRGAQPSHLSHHRLIQMTWQPWRLRQVSPTKVGGAT